MLHGPIVSYYFITLILNALSEYVEVETWSSPRWEGFMAPSLITNLTGLVA